MGELTREQQRALALARARVRAAEASPPPAQPESPAAPSTAMDLLRQQGGQSEATGGSIDVIRPMSGAPEEPPVIDTSRLRAEQGQQSGGGMAGDIVRSGLSGIARGTGALLSLPSMAGEGLDQLYEKTGLIPEGSAARRQEQSLLSSENIMGVVDALTSGSTSYEPETTAGDYAQTVGEFAPGGVAARAPVMMGTVIPALGSEAAGQSTEGTSLEPYARIAGAITAPMAASRAQRVISPMAGQIDPSRAQAVETLRRAGVRPTAGQVAGPQAGTNQLYREASTTAGRQMADNASEQFTTAAMRTVGSNAQRATPDALQEATTRIGSVFDDAIQGVPITPSQANVTRFRTVVDQAEDLTASGMPRLFERIGQSVDDAVRSGQPIRPEVARTWRSNLSSLTKNQDAGVRSAAIDGLEVIDDIIENSLTAANRPQAVAQLTEARRQYRNLLAIERAAMRSDDGVLTPQALRTSLLGQSRRQYTQAQGDLAPLTRAGNEVLERLPNSGTSQRTLAQQLTSNAQTGTGAGLGSFGLGLDPVMATGVGVAATVAPAARNQFMSSPIGQRYFLNQLAKRADVTPRMIASMLTGTAAQQQ